MNNKELQALRKLFFLSTAEAAEHIGGVSTRSWQHWESGKYSVPRDVAEKMNALVDRRLVMIETCEDLINEQNNAVDQVMIDYDMTFGQYLARHPDADIMDWRLTQSVAAYFLGEKIVALTSPHP